MPDSTRDSSIFVSLTCNILLVIGKGLAGLLANSNALVADAIHSLTDVSAFFVNYRACRNCELYGRIDENRTSKRTSQRILETELRATYYTGALLLTIGMAICFYNSAILVLGRVESPDSITVVVAFIALAVYAGLYKYLGGTDAKVAKYCVLTSRNAHWQNRMNLISGTVVVLGLSGSMLGWFSMDELAAVVVGSILVAMGIKLLSEISEDLDARVRQPSKLTVFSSILVSITLAVVCLLIRL